MDIISHGLWGSIAFGRKNKKSFWLSFLLGIGPDLFAFAPFFILSLIGIRSNGWKIGEPPNPATIPPYVYQAYDISHSLVIFSLVFIVLWLIFRKPIWEFSAWGLHILVDMPTHSTNFFPTPFLWPVSDLRIDGHPWSDPLIFFPNVLLLVTLYLWYFWIRPKHLDKIKFK